MFVFLFYSRRIKQNNIHSPLRLFVLVCFSARFGCIAQGRRGARGEESHPPPALEYGYLHTCKTASCLD